MVWQSSKLEAFPATAEAATAEAATAHPSEARREERPNRSTRRCGQLTTGLFDLVVILTTGQNSFTDPTVTTVGVF
jgi:hypothetical protein